LRTVAQGGKKAFYEGPIAEAIAQVIRAAGGCMTEADLAAHTSTWETPSSVTYRGYRVYECPPNGQGITALIALNLLEGFVFSSTELLSPESLHLQIEALRLAFADARWYIADPAFTQIPLEQLLSKDYAAERRKVLDPRRATLDPSRGAPVASSDTVYLSVVDKSGNACSFINSNYMGFGTGIVPKGWGFTLQNRGHNFSLDPGHPNALAPGKRPYHTIIPALATRESDGSLFASFGVMGGFMQPQGHVQVFSALVDGGLDPQSALDLPRFCIDSSARTGTVSLEQGIPVETQMRLAEMGHPIQSVAGIGRSLFGRGQVILRDPGTGVLTAGSDPRADGCAMTLV
jgi:gamma-glutamyltranspeptidase/glutathione hydrolase